jgi:hypothetical protein
MENVVVIQGRSLQEGAWSDVQAVSATDRGENIWVDMLWDGQRLGLVWQVSSSKLFYKSSDIIYREWEGGFLSTPLDLTSSLRGSFNGRPELGFAGDEVRVYWHTNDDGFTVGNSYDLVWRSREEGGHWGPLETFQVDRTRELYQIYLTEHEGGLYASWMANVTYVLPPPLGTMSVWDISLGCPSPTGGRGPSSSGDPRTLSASAWSGTGSRWGELQYRSWSRIQEAMWRWSSRAQREGTDG